MDFIFAALHLGFSGINCDIHELNGDKIWKERILQHLGWMDIDYAIRHDEPPTVTATSTPAQVILYDR